jgi:excisionase family DNA binding protein
MPPKTKHIAFRVSPEFIDRYAALTRRHGLSKIELLYKLVSAAERGVDEPDGATRLLTSEQLATRWQVSTQHVYRLARDGKLPTVSLGKYVRFRIDEIEAFEAAGGVAIDGD